MVAKHLDTSVKITIYPAQSTTAATLAATPATAQKTTQRPRRRAGRRTTLGKIRLSSYSPGHPLYWSPPLSPTSLPLHVLAALAPRASTPLSLPGHAPADRGAWALSRIVVGLLRGLYTVVEGSRVLYDSLVFSEALQYAVDHAASRRGVVVVEPGEYVATEAIEPRSGVTVDFSWARVRLKKGLKSLFQRDYQGRGGIEDFAVRRLVLVGNRCELEPPGSRESDIRTNREEPFVVRLLNLDGGRGITLEDLVLRDYYGGPLAITLCPAERCESAQRDGRPRPLVGVAVRRVKGLDASTVLPEIRRHYGRRPEAALDSVYNVVVEDLELRLSSRGHRELYRMRHRIGIRGCVNTVIRNVYAEKASDGPLVLLESCRNTVVENIATRLQHDYAVSLVGAQNTVARNISVHEPRAWGAVFAHIAESPLGRLGAVAIENILVEKPQRPHTYPAVHICNDAKHRPAIIQHIQVRNVAAEAMKTAVEMEIGSGEASVALDNVTCRKCTSIIIAG